MKKLFKKKILHRAKYRGVKELDIIFEKFVEKFQETISEEELIQLEEILEIPDNEMLEIILQKKELPANLNNDVIFNPVHIKTLIVILNKLLKKKKIGILNVSSDLPISKYNFGKKIINKLKLNNKYLTESSIHINKKFVAKRSKNMYLDNKRLKRTLKIKKLDINKEINLLLKKFLKYK